MGGVLEGLRRSIDTHVRSAKTHRPFDRGGLLAASHGTEFPLVQGPMTRVSDVSAFAASVAEGGGLPFLALALFRAPQVEKLLQETKEKLGDSPWGVGILGFVPPDLRQEQLEVIHRFRPPYALIAGGRPDQARDLEKKGIPTYLHVPSPALLGSFLEKGARRFVFEGRECGGHVGPRSSFVLWEAMIDILLEAVQGGVRAEDLHVLFAGGIHDARSAAMVAAMSAPLAEHGVRLGLLMGTAYLFTEEAVNSGAIVSGFQEVAVGCAQTGLLEVAPGHVIRAATTPYLKTFQETRRRLLAGQEPREEVQEVLEHLTLGRLRIASKGIKRENGQDTQPNYITVSGDEQQSDGIYMIGQLASLQKQTRPIADVHRQVSVGGSLLLDGLSVSTKHDDTLSARAEPCHVAIIGMGCLLPKAQNVNTFWSNVLGKVDGITEIPKERFDSDLYFDKDPKGRDRIYSKWGGFLDDVVFDPLRYGIPPNALSSIDPFQLLTLEVVQQALGDAGYLNRAFPRERTSVILGSSGGLGDLGLRYGVRSTLPMILDDVPPEVMERLPEWTEDSFAGILLNVAAGRVSNRFDLGGVNFTVDAACASSLTAIYLAARELQNGTSDMVLAGGVDTVQSPFGFLCFSKTQALSAEGRCKTFDENADGIAISEGLAVLVLKRLADAERDGDRIYAVIRSVAGSSDGRDRSLTAPRLEGQVEALKRAYSEARIDPSTVGLVEAHGTGTVAGDTTEVAALSQVFGSAGALPKSCGLGSVKSMIGHTKGSAGVAGVMKVALSLHHKVLPPTLHVEKPNSKLREPSNPFFVSGEALPWLSRGEDAPRRGGVSSFGFGGTNFHAVLEEYTGDFTDPARRPTSQRWDSEILYWKATSADQLKKSLASLQAWLVSGAEPRLRDLASTVCAMAEAADRSASQVRLIVSSSLGDLREQLRIAMRALESPSAEPAGDSRGVYLMWGDTPQTDRMAFLFPGQGSQYPYMLRDLSLHFPEFREHLERASQLLAGKFAKNLHHYVFPPPAYRPEDEAEQMRALTDTVVAQPALGAVEMGLFKLLARLGVKPDMTAGHSYGEYVALCAAGVLEEQSLLEISEIRGRLIKESTGKNAGKMLAVTAGETEVVEALRGVSGVWLANFNGPAQTIVAGAVEDLDRARTALQEAGLLARPVPVACAFHTPLMEGTRRQLAAALTQIDFAQPKLEVFSNSAAQPYSSNPTDIRATLAAHLVRPVQFLNEIEAMYRSGARVFVEVGPKSVLTNLVNQILEGRSDVCAISTDLHGEDGLSQLLRTLAQLKVRGVPVNFEPLFEGRALTRSNWSLLSDQASKTGPASLPWLVNGSGVRPASGKTDASATATESTRSRPAGSKHTPPSSEHLSSLDILPTGGREESSPVSTPGTDTDGTMEKKKNEKTSVQPTEVTSQPVHQLSHSSPGMDDHEKIMLRFQDLMSQFLQTQREVMTAYLQNGDSAELRSVEASREFLAAPAAHEETVGLHTDIAQSPQDGAPLPSALPEVDGQGKQSHARPDPAPLQEERPDPPDETPLAGSEDLGTRLVRLVSERTGYPPDMLGLDMNLEADLGIDSIKRVEILSAFERESGADEQNKIQAMMDQLTGVRTLQEIIDLLSGSPHPDGGGSPAEPPPDRCSDSESVKGGEVVEAGGVPRFTLSIVDAPLGEISEPDFTDRVFVITDDEMGVGKELSRKLAAQNARAVLLRHRTKVSALEPNVYGADLTQASQVEEVLRTVTDRHGLIRAVVHLLPLKCDSDFAVANLQEAQHWVRRDIKSLFNLAKSAEKDLRKNNDSMFMTVTATGGTFSHSSESFYSPTHGGVTAFIKTLVQEWPEVQFKAIDVEPGQQATQLSGKLWNELAGSDDIVQVGYSDERRFSVVPQVSPLMGDQPFEQWGIKPQSDWVFLLTGGARGITAEISSFLARSFTPTLVLAGLSPTPVDEESSVTSGLTESADLKAALTAKLRESQASVRPVEVEQAYRRLLREREIRQNVAALREMGAKVEYHQVDVRNEDGFGQMIDGIYDRHGRLDAVIHGAGIIEDKLLTDKTPESFDRVLHTKTDSAFTLMRKLRPETLKLLLFMSSVTATFGNRGQCDYGAANGILNSLAHLLSKRWQARVVALNWGPWDKHGMVSDEVRAQFLERGIQVIPPQAGVEAIAREIADTATSNAVVVVGDGPWSKQLGSSQSQLRVASG